MTPLPSTRHRWQRPFGETPRPPALPDDVDLVRVGMSLGMSAIGTLIDAGFVVGMLLCRLVPRVLLIPVISGTTCPWAALLSSYRSGPTIPCVTHGYRPPWQRRLWVTAPDLLGAPTTAAAVLHEWCSVMHARIRREWGPLGTRGREVCHV
jgi:hypothetical protein